MYNKTRFGYTRTGIGGTYPVNNGDPQCDDPEFDQERFERDLEQAKVDAVEEREERLGR